MTEKRIWEPGSTLEEKTKLLTTNLTGYPYVNEVILSALREQWREATQAAVSSQSRTWTYWTHGMTLKELRVLAIRDALTFFKRNKTKAAKALGISKRALFSYVVSEPALSEFKFDPSKDWRNF